MSGTPAERAEDRATRRRWITLAEVVAVGGLVIGAAGLWMTWSDRRADQADRVAERASEQRSRTLVTLTGTAGGGDTITLSDPAHTISAATVTLPSALHIAQQDAMPGPRIARDWFERPLLQLTDGGPDERSGYLPVLVTTSWWDGAEQRRDAAIYDVLWRSHGRLVGGRRIELTGLTLRSRDHTAAALDRAWIASAPSPLRGERR